MLIPSLLLLALLGRARAEEAAKEEEKEQVPVLVNTSYGDIEGFEHLTPSGQPLKVFLGIRYGQAPDIYNRFKKAEIVEKWAPIRHHAKRFKAACIPYHAAVLHEDANFSEDCLFVNIITPSTEGTSLPVLVFIHGGGFQIGSAEAYGYETLANTIAAQGVVVVTIQYRLGPFGWFTLGDAVAPGNQGLWDATLALHFLHDVLPSFGGDVSRITVSGHSAGSCIASALQYSPHSNSLFQQTFLMSGSSLSEFALSESVVGESIKLAEELKCYAKDSSTMTIDCMQMKTAEEIVAAVDKIGSTRVHTNILKFHPRLDGDFFQHPIERLAKTASKKRTVLGVVDQEGALFVLHEWLSFLSGLIIPEDKRSEYTREQLEEFITQKVATDHEHHDDAGPFRDLLIDFYINRDEREGDAEFYLSRFIELASDLMFVVPFYHEAVVNAANGWPMWLYILDHPQPQDTIRKDHPVQGAYHGDELHYFTDSPFRPTPLSEEDEKIGKNFVSAIVAFTKTGDPSFPSFDWLAVNKESPFRNAVFREKMSMRKDPFRGDAVHLWLKEVPAVVPGEKLRKSRLPGSEAHIIHSEL